MRHTNRMKQKEDSYYIDRILEGDHAAFDYLINRHKDWVFTIVLRIVKIREDAEEIAQDVFIKAFQSLDTFKNDAKFSTWLYRIAFNTAISKIRKKKIETSPMDETLVENYTQDELVEDLSQMNSDEQKILIEQALEKLNDDENLIIRLFYQKSATVADIAEITGLSEANVKVKLHRIRKKLHTILSGLTQKEYLET